MLSISCPFKPSRIFRISQPSNTKTIIVTPMTRWYRAIPIITAMGIFPSFMGTFLSPQSYVLISTRAHSSKCTKEKGNNYYTYYKKYGHFIEACYRKKWCIYCHKKFHKENVCRKKQKLWWRKGKRKGKYGLRDRPWWSIFGDNALTCKNKQ